LWSQGVGTTGDISLKGTWMPTASTNVDVLEIGLGTVRIYQKDASFRYVNAVIESQTMSSMKLKVTSVNGYAGFIAGDTINVIYYIDTGNILYFGWEPHYTPQYYASYTLQEE
jgi:hypothetical protein